MELPDDSIMKTVITVIMAGFAWIWARINGDLKAAKAVADASVPTVVFEKFLQKQSDRDETLFDLLREHTQRDSEAFMRIEGSLARLDERSKQRRGMDA